MSMRRRQIYRDIDTHLRYQRKSGIGIKLGAVAKSCVRGISKVSDYFKRSKSDDHVDPSYMHNPDETEVDPQMVDDILENEPLENGEPVLQAHHYSAVDAEMPTSQRTVKLDESEEDKFDTYEPEEQKEPWYRRFFGMKRFEEQEEDVLLDSPLEDIQNDLRNVARLSLAMIKDIDSESLQKIKDSAEFNEYKEILRRHKIIK